MNAKILFQTLWKDKIGWDELLVGTNLAKYVAFHKLLSSSAHLSMNRLLSASTAKKEIHIFCDASKLSYGCVAYLRERIDEKLINVSFLIAKGRVAPVRPMSIKRLELLGALLSARMLNKLKEIMKSQIKSTHLYSDNKSVLGWVASDPGKWKPFVANRIRRIHQLIGQADWNFVGTKFNPADALSRGKYITEEDMWFKGPPMLHLSDIELSDWKENNRPASKLADLKEIETERESTTKTCSTSTHIGSGIFFERSFSSFTKAIRFWAYMRRLRAKAETAKQGVREKVKCSPLPHQEFRTATVNEMIEARIDLIQQMQKTFFSEEYHSLCKKIKRTSIIRNYAPYMENGLIRCKSRLEYSTTYSNEKKSPILILSEGNLTKLLIKCVHEHRCFHFGGVANTLHRLREEFLVLKARKLTGEVLNSCQTCKIFNSKHACLPMAQIPENRLENAPCFTHSAVDFAGPIKYKNDDNRISKSYLLIWTCLVTRGVHIELTKDTSTVEVLGGLQKFINRFPAVKTITSDNGASFLRASRELALIYESISEGEIKKLLAESFIRWNFVCPASPWMNGAVERMVAMVKKPIRKSLGSSIPHFRDLEVLITGIEAMINRRPITAVATDSDDVEALSPSDLMFGYKGNSFLPDHNPHPKKSKDADKVISSRRWRYQQTVLNSFWKRFQEEYLADPQTAGTSEFHPG